MMERAQAMGANAVVGIDIDYETIGETNSMLMVATSGTAVVIMTALEMLDTGDRYEKRMKRAKMPISTSSPAFLHSMIDSCLKKFATA